LDVAVQDVSDRLDAAVRVPREALKEILRASRAEVVQEEERIEQPGLPEAEGAAQLHSRSLDRRLAVVRKLYGTVGLHGGHRLSLPDHLVSLTSVYTLRSSLSTGGRTRCRASRASGRCAGRPCSCRSRASGRSPTPSP